MDKIEIKILNEQVIPDTEKMMVAMARLTQRGHKIQTMDDLLTLIEQDYKQSTLETMLDLPHPTIQKFGAINIAIVGASRRFLAQITRHQNEVKFMSGSLQYSDYSDSSQFCIPYEIMVAEDAWRKEIGTPTKLQILAGSPVQYYLDSCEVSMRNYRGLASEAGNDAAGYTAPQGLRNVLVVSATPYQWKHMISQRSCRRNTLETRYVMMRCWEELAQVSDMFRYSGPPCVCKDCKCPEGKMSCGVPMLKDITVSEAIDADFSLIRR